MSWRGLRDNLWWIAAALVAFVRISIGRSQYIYALGPAMHDDALFMRLAGFISRGEWLGPYDNLTLAKGAAYPVFIAANFWVGFPLGLSQQLLYVVGCFAVVMAIKPWFTSGWARWLAFSFLVLNPLTYDGANMSRILRQHLSIPMALLVVAGVVGLMARRDRALRDRLPWAILLGAAAGVFYLTREEGIWIAPIIVMGAGATLIGAWRSGERKGLGVAAGLWGGAGLVAAIPITLVCALNAHFYGWWGTNEFRADSFKEAVGLVSNVKVGDRRPYVASTRQQREAIYVVSPAFAELQPYLDQEGSATKWMDREKYPEEECYLTGWFMWALRDAMAAAGQAGSPHEVLAYCERVTSEVKAAIRDGRLHKTEWSSGYLPTWHEEYGKRLRAESWPYLRDALRLTQYEVIVPVSEGTDDDIRLFFDLSYDTLSPSLSATYIHKPDQLRVNVIKLTWLRDLAEGLRGKFYLVFCLGALVLLVRVVEQVVRRRWSWPCWAALSLVATGLAEVAINLLVHVLAFPNFYPAAYAPAYPIFQFAAILVWFDAALAWGGPIIAALKARWGRSTPTTPVAGT